RHPRPHAPSAHQPHRQHPFPRRAVDGVALALRARRLAGAHGANGSARSLQSARRPGRRLDRRSPRRLGRQDLQPVEPEPRDGVSTLHRDPGCPGQTAHLELEELLMPTLSTRLCTALGLGAAVAIVVSCGGASKPPEGPPASGSEAAAAGTGGPSGEIEVMLCDGQTTTRVPAGTPGTTIAGAL